jgi:hypothetical protein
MCLELLCTSTQSSTLKWVSGGGINTPRHQTRCWLKAAEKGTVGWTDAMLFQGVGSSGAPPTSHSRWGSLTQLLWRYALTVRWIIRCWRLCLGASLYEFKLNVGSPDGDLTSNRRIIRCYCLRCSSSASRPTLLKVGPSVHLTVPRVSPFIWTNSSDDCTDACYWETVDSSNGVFSFSFLARFWP